MTRADDIARRVRQATATDPSRTHITVHPDFDGYEIGGLADNGEGVYYSTGPGTDAKGRLSVLGEILGITQEDT